MPKENPITINLSSLDFSSFNFSEVDLSQMGLSEKDLTKLGLLGVDLTKVNLTNVDLTNFDLNNVDCSKVDPHLPCLMIFFPFLKQKMEEEKEGFYLENGGYNYFWTDPKTKSEQRYNFNFVGSILVRPQEQKENSTKLKDGYRIEVLGAGRQGGHFSLIYPVEKTIRLKSAFTLDIAKPYSNASKKRIVKKQRGKEDIISNLNDQWVVKLNEKEICKTKVSRKSVAKESNMLKKYPKLSAKTLIENKRSKGEYLVFQIMKQAPGEGLDDLLAPENVEDEQPDFQTRLSLFLALVQEVKDLHDQSKMIHCDLKPENVCVHRDTLSSPFNITLIDFGASKLIAAQAEKGLTHHGTDPYFAPEQNSYGAENITPKVDVYALGQMMKIDFFTTDLQEEVRYKTLPREEVELMQYDENLSECEKKQNKALQDLAKEMTRDKPKDRLDLGRVIEQLKDIKQALSKEESQAAVNITALDIDPETNKIDGCSESGSMDSGLELSEQSAASNSDLSDLSDVSDLSEVEDLGVIPSVNLLQLDLNSSVISSFFRHLHEKISENANKAFYCPPAHYVYSETDAEGKRCTYKLQLENSILVRPQEQKENSKKSKKGYRIEVLGAAEDKDGTFSLTCPVLNTIRLNSNFILDKNKPFSNKKRIVKIQQLSKTNSDDKWGIDEIKNKKLVSVEDIEKENRLLKTYTKLSAKTLVECEYGSNNKQCVYQIMKEAPGERLDYFLNSKLEKPSLPSFQTRLKIFSALVREVRALNLDKEIVHGDLKPANIFVKYSEDSPAAEITLIDFGGGVSKQDQELDLIQTISPFYSAPEQGSINYPTKADIYALGQMIKKDFFPADTQSMSEQSRLNGLPADQRAMHFVYKKRVGEEKLSSSEHKQKAALQDLARFMTYGDPASRFDLDQVIERLNIIQNDISLVTEHEAEVENRILQSESSSFEETGSYESDSDESGIDSANQSSTSSEQSFVISNLDERQAEDAALDNSESSTAPSAVLASVDPALLQEENTRLPENADLLVTEHEAEVENRILQSESSSFEETASYESDSDESGIDSANRSSISSELSFVISNSDERQAEDAALDNSESNTVHSAVLASADPASLQEENTLPPENADLLVTEHEAEVESRTLQSESSSFEETGSCESDSDESGIDSANQSSTSSEQSSAISNSDERLAEDANLDSSESSTAPSAVLASASLSRPPVEETVQWTRQGRLLEILEKEMNDESLLALYSEQDELAKLVKEIKKHPSFKDQAKQEHASNAKQSNPLISRLAGILVRIKEKYSFFKDQAKQEHASNAKQPNHLISRLAGILVRILKETPDKDQEGDQFDLKIRQELVRYIAQTYTPENIRNEDRVASSNRVADIERLLTQLQGATQGEGPKTELDLKERVNSWANKVTNRWGFFGKSALRSGVLAAVDLTSNTAPTEPLSVFTCFRSFTR